MSTSNEDLVTPDTGSTLQANSTPPSNSQVGEPESNASGINSNEGQQPACNNEATTGNEGCVSGTSGDFPIANAALSLSPLAMPSSKVIIHLVSPKGLPCVEFIQFYWKLSLMMSQLSIC